MDLTNVTQAPLTEVGSRSKIRTGQETKNLDEILLETLPFQRYDFGSHTPIQSNLDRWISQPRLVWSSSGSSSTRCPTAIGNGSSSWSQELTPTNELYMECSVSMIKASSVSINDEDHHARHWCIHDKGQPPWHYLPLIDHEGIQTYKNQPWLGTWWCTREIQWQLDAGSARQLVT